MRQLTGSILSFFPALSKLLTLECEHTCRLSGCEMLEQSTWHLWSGYLNHSEIKCNWLSLLHTMTHSHIMKGVWESWGPQTHTMHIFSVSKSQLHYRLCFRESITIFSDHGFTLSNITCFRFLIFLPVFSPGFKCLMRHCVVLQCRLMFSGASSHTPSHRPSLISPD